MKNSNKPPVICFSGPVSDSVAWEDHAVPTLMQQPIFRDRRGSFTVLGAGTATRQTNLSVSNYNVIRGMHWQAGDAQITKYVRCIGGRIYDVVVDMRPKSPTFGGWKGFELVGGASTTGNRQDGLVVPKGFAHGFQVLSNNATVLYEQDGVWSPDDERAVNPFCPEIGIQWFRSTVDPTVSEKDELAPGLSFFK